MKNSLPAYKTDILQKGFEQYTIVLPDDYEGKVTATLIRRLTKSVSDKAVLYIHGFNDYFFQTEMADHFNKKDYNFYALDLRKYGRSYLDHQKFNDIRDLKDYYVEISKSLHIIHNEKNKKVILIGHSTGGLILTLFAKDRTDEDYYDGIILNSPFYEFNKSKLIKLILPAASFIGLILPKLKIPGGFSEKYGKSIHRDFAGEWEYDLGWKPNVAPKVNLGWIRAIYKGQKELKTKFSIYKPLLIFHSEKSATDLNDPKQVQYRDVILNVKDIQKISGNIMGDVEIISVKGGIHDLFLSGLSIRENVYTFIWKWLKKHHL